MTTLFDSYRLGDLVLPNRVVMAPMTRVRAAAGGLATPSMATYYAQRGARTSSASAAPSSPTPTSSSGCAPRSRSHPSTMPPTTRAVTRAI
ncbi:oxidoreductase [Nonomuraea glycinis]|uniref:NADH:flavin oxidoreductase/NADH oxidase N-terminal domain-containing protein n=1 Tax=Nonomuraea glycinis TaxID=2047744 RepID=A0A918A2Q4_9ACTN|nr:hypothetical protein GCM10012278_05600 [Nonomuraea glycinis]